MILIDDQPIFAEEYDLLEKQAQERRGFSYLNKLKNLVIGSGDLSFRADKKGIWLGAAEFESASFRVDMQGNLVVVGGTITGGIIQTANTGQRVVMDTSGILKFYSSEGVNCLNIYADYFSPNSFMLFYNPVGTEAIRFGSNSFKITGANYFEINKASTVDFIFQGMGGDNPYFCHLTANKAVSGYPGAWKEVRSHVFTDLCNIYDKLDAISLLKGIGIKGKDEKGYDKMDNDTLPDFIKAEKRKPNELTFRNLGRYVDLLASAIKQLDERLEKLENK